MYHAYPYIYLNIKIQKKLKTAEKRRRLKRIIPDFLSNNNFLSFKIQS